MPDVIFVDARENDERTFPPTEWQKCEKIGEGYIEEAKITIVNDEICLPALLENVEWETAWVVCLPGLLIIGRV